MDHGLRNVSFIADIGDILVLMARRDAAEKDKDVEMRPSQILASIGSGTTDRETIKITCHVFQSEEVRRQLRLLILSLVLLCFQTSK